MTVDMIRTAAALSLAVDILADGDYRTALRVHRQDCRNCISCGQSWPCSLARLARQAEAKDARRTGRAASAADRGLAAAPAPTGNPETGDAHSAPTRRAS